MGVLDGSITSGRRMVQFAKKMLPRIRDGYKRWHFDVNAAVRPVEFIETFCCIPSGKLYEPFILEDYELAVVMLAFGFVDEDGIREFQYVLVEWARKNGKTSLAAALELYLLLSDGEGAPQIYNAATSKSQASLAYGAVWRMARQSNKIMKHLRRGTVMERAETGIICDANMGYIIPLSKQTDHLDGLDVHGAILDEMAAMEDRSIYDLIKQGTGARSQPLMFAITTQGYVRDNIWDHERDYAIRWLEGEIEDDRFFAMLYEMDDRSEIWNEDMWVKANPGLGTVKKVEYIRSQVLKAQNDPSYLPTLLTKDFNLPANQATAYFSYEEAVNPEKFTFTSDEFRYCIVGFDAADTIDLTAAVAMFMRQGDDHIYERAMFWMPEDQVVINSNAQRGRDGVPYHEWEQRGLLRFVPGNHVDKSVLLEWLHELYNEGLYIFAVGYDKWHMDDSTVRDLKSFVGESRVQPVPQNVMTLSQPMKQIKADLRDNRIIDNHNPIMEWCRMNVSAKIDANDNVFPFKKAGPTSRIDGFMAELDAYVTFQRFQNDYLSVI